MLKLAQQTYNSKKLYVSPDQSTLKAKFNVPAPEIKDTCRLHSERHNDYDFFNQWATTICCGMAYFL
jgi:hypothetical protein